MPLALPLLVPGLAADAWAIAKPLLLLMLIPLAVGFALPSGERPWRTTLLAVVRKVSNLAFALLLILMIVLNLKTLLGTLGSFAIATYAVFVLVLVGAGYLVGLLDKTTQPVFALGAANRNIAAGLVVAGASFDDPAVTVMLIVASVVGLAILIGVARVMRPKQVGLSAA